jgi:hypothetical protein
VLIDLVGIGVVLLLTVLTGERARLRRDTWDDPTPEPEPAAT